MGKRVDLTGLRFGKLIAVYSLDRADAKRSILWKCKCDCGNFIEVSNGDLRKGDKKSCGCLKNKIPKSEFLDVVKETSYSPINSVRYFVCFCKLCGKAFEANYSNISRGQKSCGCISGKTNKKHGHKVNNTTSRTYYSWQSMKSRCTNLNDSSYYRYGGRGIEICSRWLSSFENFLEDMGERPENTTLDRIDVNGNYEPENCKWSTIKEQSRNKRNSIKIDYNSKLITLRELSNITGIKYQTLYWRNKNKTK